MSRSCNQQNQQTMKKIFIFLLFTITTVSYGQTEIYKKFLSADSLMQANNFTEAYTRFNEIEQTCDKNDTLYSSILWYFVGTVTTLEKSYRMNEKFDSALVYSLKALELIKKGKPLFDKKFALREVWMRKNVIISYFGLGQLDKAKIYQQMLYKAYKNSELPDGIDKFYNFTFFKWDNKNIWGYEWYEELPKDRFSKSFSKIVYYVYSTNPDGSDKEQLYRLHVLMFHSLTPKSTFDYVLTKRLETATDEVSGTFYDYTYDEKIDYVKLQADIREVLKGNYKSDVKSTIKQN